MANKKLYRNEDGSVIAGVCNGIADYFDIDVTLVRIIFVLLLIGGGSGFLIYLVLWIVVPTKNDKAIIEDKEKINDLVKEVSKKGKTMAKEIKKEMKIEKVKTKRDRGGFLGVILMVFGMLILFERMFQFIIRWDYVWPIILIACGAYLVFRD